VEDLLLLPGMMLDARMYEAQAAALSACARVRIGHLRGGESIAAISAQVLKDAPARFAVVGFSMGGIVAMDMWRLAPLRISRLALLDTTPFAETPERQALRLGEVARGEAGHLRDVIETLVPRYFAHRNAANHRLVQSVLDQALGLGALVFRQQSLALRDRSESVATLPTIGCPALVLCGREDQLCPVGYHEMMAKAIPRADLVVLAGCGHLSPMEEPRAVTAAIEGLLQRES